MVSDVTLSGAAASATNTQQSQVTLAEDFNEFLQLLTTQLQNQDPLEPLDSKEFTDQLVQFSQVEQQINQNSKLDDLIALNLNNAATSALGYVGMDISYVSAEIAYDGENSSTIRYSLDDPAVSTTINIFDEENVLVFSATGDTEVGVHDFEWNGRTSGGDSLPEGTYIVSIDSLDSEDNVVETTTVVQGRVEGIEQQDGLVYALVGERAVPISTILNAVNPEEETTPAPESGSEG